MSACLDPAPRDSLQVAPPEERRQIDVRYFGARLMGRLFCRYVRLEISAYVAAGNRNGESAIESARRSADIEVSRDRGLDRAIRDKARGIRGRQFIDRHFCFRVELFQIVKLTAKPNS